MDETTDVEEARKTELVAARAKERAQLARWDINSVVFLFAVLILVLILLYEGFGVEVVGPVAFVGLALVWLVGWRRERQLYRYFLSDELLKLERRELEEDRTILQEIIKSRREKEK
ncbi:MAG: hypothetical protein ACE5IA_04175 [Dehalococcoidia bacterium]